jgi:hypothetical protein
VVVVVVAVVVVVLAAAAALDNDESVEAVAANAVENDRGENGAPGGCGKSRCGCCRCVEQ